MNKTVNQGSKYTDSKIDYMERGELEKLQLKRIKETLRWASENSRFYRELYKEISIKTINSFSDFRKLPFTTKKDLVNNYPFGNLCVPQKEVVEVHFSSGTTNRPVPTYMTQEDLLLSNEALARTWYMQGVCSNTVFGMLASYGLFSAGLLNHYAIQKLGAFVIPISSSSTDKTIGLLKDYSINATAAVTSYYLYLVNRIRELGYSKDNFNLEIAIAGGEPFTENQRDYIEKNLGTELLDQYGISEINTGLAGECKLKNGLHILADYAYPEIVDTETGEVCEEGKSGELVLTTLAKRASPLIRYKTGDMASITYKKCGCGRTLPRISKIMRRKGGTLFYKGRKIEREFVISFMEDQDDYLDPYIWKLILSGNMGNQKMFFRVLVKGDNNQKDCLRKLEMEFKKKAGINVKAKLFSESELKSLEEDKLKHFVDRRKEVGK